MIIVIDGPAGAGKSSTAKAVAKKLNINYLDSGALYRAYAWLFNELNHDKEAFVSSLSSANVSFSYAGETFHVFVNENNITDHLRNTEVSETVSEVAAFTDVRECVNEIMHKAVKQDNFIAEGRDLGTAVFPDAALKIFMIADQEERARRRLKQKREANDEASLNAVLDNIKQRDQKDSSRESDPLQKADDAIEIDTTKLNFDEQVHQICVLADVKTTLNYNTNHNTISENPE